MTLHYPSDATEVRVRQGDGRRRGVDRARDEEARLPKASACVQSLPRERGCSRVEFSDGRIGTARQLRDTRVQGKPVRKVHRQPWDRIRGDVEDRSLIRL